MGLEQSDEKHTGHVDVLSQPIHQRWGSVSPPKEQVIGQDKTASSCTWGGFDWISGKISSLEVRPAIGTACPEKQWNHHPWKCPQNTQMWFLVTGFSDELGSAGLMFGLNDIRDVFQPQ